MAHMSQIGRRLTRKAFLMNQLAHLDCSGMHCNEFLLQYFLGEGVKSSVHGAYGKHKQQESFYNAYKPRDYV